MIKSAFAGEEELFKGLYLEKNWDWSKKYSVIHLSFGGGHASSVDILHQLFQFNLDRNAEQYGIELSQSYTPNRFGELIQALYDKTTMPVVVLIDEYDKPILDNLEKPELAEILRDELKTLYAMIKDNDAYIKFVLLTGVSKFSKISLFSGLTHANPSEIKHNRIAIYKALKKADFESIEQAISALFASIPHNWYRKNQMSEYEGYYASVV